MKFSAFFRWKKARSLLVANVQIGGSPAEYRATQFDTVHSSAPVVRWIILLY